MRRRSLLALPAWWAGAASPLAAAVRATAAPGQGDSLETVGATLSPWRPGVLDIHHIATGRGNATFALLPDGTTLLIDAGASLSGPDVSAQPRPDASRRPGEWIARYAQRHMRPAGRDRLDYLLVTHLHPDHFGDVNDASPPSRQGTHLLGGVSDVAEVLPIGTLIDRGYPDYAPVMPLHHVRFTQNYLAFLQARVRAGGRVEPIRVGRNDQIRLLRSTSVPAPFEVRNIAANGRVWTGQGMDTQTRFPPVTTLAEADRPNENMASIAIRIGYGRFSYFTAGDLTSYTYDGEQPWRDVMTPAAQAAGPVDVATADHHGMFDGLSADSVRALRPRAWVIPTWHISHPDMLQLERMLGERLYPGPRDVFATNVMRENLLANRRLMLRLRSTDGHIIVRVAPGGATFQMIVTDHRDEADRIAWASEAYAAGERPPLRRPGAT